MQEECAQVLVLTLNPYSGAFGLEPTRLLLVLVFSLFYIIL